MLNLEVCFCAMLTSASADFISGMLSNASLIFTRFSLPVLDDFTDKDMRNIERIYKNVLVTTKSREQQKALVKKYLGWVSRLPKKKGELFFFVCLFQCRFRQLRKKFESLEHGDEGVKVGQIRTKFDFSSNKDC